MQSLTKKKIKFLVFSFISYLSLSPVFAIPPTYCSSEHLTAGDNVKIRLNKNSEAKAKFIFRLPNSLELSYGDIVTFGDFYGDPEKVIALGKSNLEREERFKYAFDMFARDDKYLSEAKQLIEVVHNEQNIIFTDIKNGAEPEAAYEKIGDETSRQFNCITGGGCSQNGWWLIPGRYLKLAEYDFDHFGDYAIIAYKVGHKLAEKEAIEAGKTFDTRRLELAFAMNAFASHFLADRFAAGHLRTPRKELSDDVSPSTTGAILSNYMHNEENYYGLHVHNGLGNQWISYGDKSYFSNRNDSNRYFLNAALQASAEHIFNAYQTGMITIDAETMNLIPYANEIGYAFNQDVSALFYYDTNEKVLMRRSDTKNVFDRNWTADWWGWSTLIQLKRERGMPSVSQRILATSNLKDKAIADGLITDPEILQLVK